MLGIGIDEGAAIVVRGDQVEVVGRSYVAIYDGEKIGDHGYFYFLAPGDEFDLSTRVAKCCRSMRKELWLPQMRERIPIRGKELEKFAGFYEQRANQAEVLLVGDRLFGEILGQGRVELIPVAEHIFYEEAWGKGIVFNLDRSGNVESVTIDEFVSKKVLPRVR